MPARTSREAIAIGVQDQARARDGDGDVATLVAPRAVLASAISIDELSRRPSRPPDHAAENRALVALAQQMATTPEGILQMLADTALTLCRAHSAGLSLLEDGDQRRNFHWRAIAGRWAPHLGGGTPRDFGPCGTVLDRNEALLFSHPERDFPYFGEVSPLLEEGLLIPFYVDGEAIGTIWVVAHDESRRFDAEDLRVLTNLGTFTAAAYQTLLSLDATIKAGRELQQSALATQQLGAIVESSEDAIVSKDLDGIIGTWNAGAERLFGYAAEEVIGRSISILIPPDRHDEEPQILARIRRGERVDHYDTVRRRKDGSLVEISLTVSPIRDAEGRIIGASKIARDITERKRAQEQQRLLLREMNHRVRNLFTLAAGVVALGTRSAQTPDDLAAAVRARLGALSRAHDLTLPSISEEEEVDDRSTTLHAMVKVIIAPFVDSGDRVLVSGPDISIGGQAVTSFALLLHEIASNAAKFGALSSPSGSVSLDCSVRQDELMLTWREHGGPQLNGQPANKGFGSLLTDATVRDQFAGQISRHWNAEGLVVHLSLSLDRLSG